jgi:hypothetical protein
MNTDKNKKEDKSKWIISAVFLLIAVPALIPVAVFGLIIWLVIKAKSNPQAEVKAPATRYTTRQKSFDECSQPVFCRHSDKSEHHVRRGKEIDPWDRPDIDISKYQRKH